MAGRWFALATYVASVYAFLPLGPRVGIALARTAAGGWLLGPGLMVLTAVGAVVLLAVLRRRGVSPWAYVLLGAAAVGYVVGFSWLRSQHLERTHLPEYGVMALLAWRALGPSVPGVVPGYVASALLAAAIGYGDELLQRIVPGRVYDLRDVAMNAAGAILGTLVLAAARARPRPRSVIVEHVPVESDAPPPRPGTGDGAVSS